MSYFKIFSLQTREEVFVIAGPYSQYFFSYDPELSSRKSIKRFVFFLTFWELVTTQYLHFLSGRTLTIFVYRYR